MKKKDDAQNMRIKILREKLDLSQREFADKIGYSTPTIGSIEIGRTSVEKRMIFVICLVFNVREEWLLKGEEPIFKECGECDSIDILVSNYHLTDVAENILRGYLSLDEEKRNALASLIAEMSSNVAEEKKNEKIQFRRTA